MKRFLTTLATTAMVAGAFTLNAPQVAASPSLTLEFSSNNSKTFPEGRQQATINLTIGGTQIVNQGVWAGLLSGRATASTDFNLDSLFLDKDNVLAYCVDILDNLRRAPTVYDIIEVPDTLDETESGKTVTRNFDRLFKFLFSVNNILATGSGTGFSFTPITGEKAWLQPNTAWLSAAIQIGIWESIYEDDQTGLAISGGQFSVSNWNSSSGKDFLRAAFNGIKQDDALGRGDYRLLTHATYQDFIIDPVPAPQTLGLMLIGLLAGLRQRVRRARGCAFAAS